MIRIENILETLKEIECPVDQLETKVTSAYKDFAKNVSKIKMERDNSHDKEGLAAYNVSSDYKENPTITVLVREGQDHYVASIEDAFIS